MLTECRMFTLNPRIVEKKCKSKVCRRHRILVVKVNLANVLLKISFDFRATTKFVEKSNICQKLKFCRKISSSMCRKCENHKTTTENGRFQK